MNRAEESPADEAVADDKSAAADTVAVADVPVNRDIDAAVAGQASCCSFRSLHSHDVHRTHPLMLLLLLLLLWPRLRLESLPECWEAGKKLLF